MNIGIAPLILIVAAVAAANNVPIVIIAPAAAIVMALAIYALDRAPRSLTVAVSLFMVTAAYYLMQALIAAPVGQEQVALPAFVPTLLRIAPYVIVGMSIIMFALEFLHGLYGPLGGSGKDKGDAQ